MSAWVWAAPLTVWGAVVLCVAIALLADLIDRATARRTRRITERDNANQHCARRKRQTGGGRRA